VLGFLSGNGYEMKDSGHKVCDRDSSSESDRSHQKLRSINSE
jgi:nuclear transcription factor Y, alpha